MNQGTKWQSSIAVLTEGNGKFHGFVEGELLFNYTRYGESIGEILLFCLGGLKKIQDIELG